MFERLRKNLSDSNYGSLGLELIVVIIGILIAFQIDRWAEDGREREQEYDYLVRLKEDLQAEIQVMDDAIQYAESRIASVLLLEEIVANPSTVTGRQDAVAVALETATWRSFPQINAFVYTELQNTGKLALIRSEPLRRELANHYTAILHSSRVGLDLEFQHQFERLTAGLLSTSELRKIEEETWNGTPMNITSERALEFTRDFVARQDAIDLLPNIAQHHVFNLKVIESARSQSLMIIEQIELLIEDVEN